MAKKIYAPRQFHDQFGTPIGIWVYTVQVDDHEVQIAGACTAHRHHKSADEARDCYKRYVSHKEVDHCHELLEVESPCQVCKAPTKWVSAIQGKKAFPLCDAHRNMESVIEFLKHAADGESPIAVDPQAGVGKDEHTRGQHWDK